MHTASFFVDEVWDEEGAFSVGGGFAGAGGLRG